MISRSKRQKLFPWYYQLSHKTRQRLTGVFVISLAIHCLVLLSLSGVVVFRHFKQPPVQFTTPPPPKERIEPRKLEFKVKVAEQQKKSGRPSATPRLTAQSIGAISLPEVKTHLKPVPTKAVSSLASFGIGGIGGGLGGGTGAGGLGLGVSQVNFFGVTERGERIAFLVDCSLSMLEDLKGGVRGYEAVKAELVKYVNRLSEGTFFNIIMFASDVDLFKPKMTLANASVKGEVEKWVAPYNKDYGRLGNLYGNWRPGINKADFFAGGRMATGGSTRMDLALAAAFDQGADTIFILSDGAPSVGKILVGKERVKYDKMVANWSKTHPPPPPPSAAEIKAWERASAAWSAQVAAEAASRTSRGLPPKIVENGGGGPPGLGWGWSGPPGMGSWSTPEIFDHIKDLREDLYNDLKKKPPRIHCVSYLADASGEQFLRDLAIKNHGRFRKIKPLVRPINEAHRQPKPIIRMGASPNTASSEARPITRMGQSIKPLPKPNDKAK